MASITQCSCGEAAIAYDYGSVHDGVLVECPSCWKERARKAEVALAEAAARADGLQAENENHDKVRTCAGCGGYLCPPLHCYGCQKYKPPEMAVALGKECDALRARAESAERERDEYRTMWSHFKAKGGEWDKLCKQLEAVERERDALRERLRAAESVCEVAEVCAGDVACADLADAVTRWRALTGPAEDKASEVVCARCGGSKVVALYVQEPLGWVSGPCPDCAGTGRDAKGDG